LIKERKSGDAAVVRRGSHAWILILQKKRRDDAVMMLHWRASTSKTGLWWCSGEEKSAHALKEDDDEWGWCWMRMVIGVSEERVLKKQQWGESLSSKGGCV
jgi:hypothetical protein